MRRLWCGVTACSAVLVLAPMAFGQTVQWRPGITAGELSSARVVRVQPNLRIQDIQALRDDQLIETPSGRRLQVGKLRAIRQAFETARLQTSRPRPAQFAILAPTPRIAPVQLRPRESVAAILARPANQVVQLTDGKTATVAQLRAIAPYVEQRYGVRLSASGGRVAPQGRALKIRSLNDLRSLPHNMSDDTIFETPSGKRVKLSELRQAYHDRRGGRPPPIAGGRP